MKRYIILGLSFLTILTSGIQTVSAVGCGAWEIYDVSKPFCVSEHCGIWSKTALSQRHFLKRRCVRKNNSVYWEYTTTRRHIDCDC